MTGRGLSLVLTMIGLGAAGLLPTAKAEPPAASSTTPPRVLDAPPYAEMLRGYPRRAGIEGIEGKAKVRCTVSPKAAVSNCSVVSETPPDMGFGEASIRFAPHVRFQPATQDGRPVSAEVIIPVTWSMEYAERPMAFAAPSQSELMAAYPAAALGAGRDGHVTLECLLETGRLAGCRVVEDGAAADGFGAAALSLAPRFNMRSCLKQKPNRPPAQETVRVSIYWIAARADGVSAGPANAVIGYGAKFTSVITGDRVDRTDC